MANEADAKRVVVAQFRRSLVINVVIVLVLGVIAVWGGVLLILERQQNLLSNSDFLSVVAFLGAGAATLLRHYQAGVDQLADLNTYMQASEMKGDRAARWRKRHKLILDRTPLTILAVSSVIELVSLVLKVS